MAFSRFSEAKIYKFMISFGTDLCVSVLDNDDEWIKLVVDDNFGPGGEMSERNETDMLTTMQQYITTVFSSSLSSRSVVEKFSRAYCSADDFIMWGDAVDL